MRPAAAESELLAALAERVAQLENALAAQAEERLPDVLGPLEERLAKLETMVLERTSVLFAQVALLEDSVKALDEDMDEVMRSRDDTRRAISRLEAERYSVAPE